MKGILFLIPVAYLVTAVCMYATITGCAVPGMIVTVELPALSDHYTIEFWEIRWWDGRQVRSTLREGRGTRAATRIHLPVDSGGAVRPLVAAVPYALIGDTATGVPLAPYGGWYRPDRELIVLDRHGGELVEALLTVVGGGIDPAVLNVPRLDMLIRTRVPRHPRRLDRTRLSNALLAQEMRSYHVSERRAPLHQVRLPWDSLEPWISDDPVERPFEPAPAGYYELFSVPVMNGEVRRLWRRCSRGGGYQLLLVYRTPAGNAFHRVIAMPSSSRQS